MQFSKYVSFAWVTLTLVPWVSSARKLLFGSKGKTDRISLPVTYTEFKDNLDSTTASTKTFLRIHSSGQHGVDFPLQSLVTRLAEWHNR